jgi:purine-nucleoside phosphorylase
MTERRPPEAEGMPGPDDTFAEVGVALIRERCEVVPRAVVVLGSGLGDAVGPDLAACHQFSFHTIPGFPPPTVPGHAGRLALGRLYGVPVAVFFGRIHYYEGRGIAATTLIPRLASGLGARVLILTNAAGGLDPTLRPGQLMLIRDHLNFMGVNPLSAWRLPDGTPAFVDLSAVYDPGLLEVASRSASERGVDAATGVYAAMSGPSSETPAEIAFRARAGALAVGMSTVPEAVGGVAVGLSVLAVSCITNLAGAEATHEDVIRTAREAAGDLKAILMGVLAELSASDGSSDVVGPGGSGPEATGGGSGL